jgi:hypothetical protein
MLVAAIVCRMRVSRNAPVQDRGGRSFRRTIHCNRLTGNCRKKGSQRFSREQVCTGGCAEEAALLRAKRGYVFVYQAREALDSFGPQGGRVACDRSFARLVETRHTPVQRRDQFVEFAHEVIVAHRHGVVLRPSSLSRRAAFQISPQLLHRQ